MHNITINDVGPVWRLLINHVLIIALHALAASGSPSHFLFPSHLLLYLSGHAPSTAGWHRQGGQPSPPFDSIGGGSTVFWRWKLAFIDSCVCQQAGIVVRGLFTGFWSPARETLCPLRRRNASSCFGWIGRLSCRLSVTLALVQPVETLHLPGHEVQKDYKNVS